MESSLGGRETCDHMTQSTHNLDSGIEQLGRCIQWSPLN